MKIRRWICRNRGTTSRRLFCFRPWEDEWRCREMQMNQLEDLEGMSVFPRLFIHKHRR